MNLAFDQIMNHLSDLTKKELFINLKYHKYLADRKTMTISELEKAYKDYWKDFKFLDNFKDKVNKVKLNSSLIHHLQKKYKGVQQSLKDRI